MSSTLDKMASVIENTIAPPLLRISANRYIVAMGNGVQTIVPLVIFGSIPMIIAFLPVPGWNEIIGPYKGMLLAPYGWTFGVMALVVSFGLAYQLATGYKEAGLSPLYSGITSLVAFFFLTKMKTDWFGAQGLLFSIILAILVVEIARLMLQKGVYVKMPKGVPPFVTETFRALTTTMAVLTIAWTISTVLNINVPQLMYDALKPIIFASDNLAIATFVTTMKGMALTIGLHPSAVIGPAMPVLYQFLAENAAAKLAGTAMPHVFTYETTMVFGSAGGAGNPFMLCVLCIFSKSEHLKRVGRLSMIPVIFGVCEPLLFGFPVTLNPLMMVGMLLATAIPALIGHALMYANIIGRTWVASFFTTPFPLKSLVTTGGDISVFIAELLVTGLLSLIIWYPFFKVYEKQLVKKEAEEKK